MESRIGQKGDTNFSQEVSRRRSFNKKPPRGSWQPAVPSWEKTFCKVVGSLDWETIVDMKKFVYLYDNVVKWDDSAGEEAFHNAKTRFLAKMRGFPCDISLPDPNLYIDEVDWDSKVDSELLSDLEDKYMVPDTAENNEPVVIFGDSLLCNQGFSSAGWGDEDLKNAANSSLNNHDNPWERSLCKSKGTAKATGWDDSGNNACVKDVSSGAMRDTGWGVGWENSCSCNHPDYQKVEPKNMRGSNYGDSILCNEGFSSAGWGDEDLKNAANSSLNNHDNPWERSLCKSKGIAKATGWDDSGNNACVKDVSSGAMRDTGWGVGWENSWSCNHPDYQKVEPKNMKGSNYGDSLLCNEGFSSAGWGDEDLKNAANSSLNNHDNPWERSLCKSKGIAKATGWDDSGNNACETDVSSGAMRDTGWGVGWENSWSCNHPDYQKVEPKKLRGSNYGGSWGTWDVSYGKKNNAGRFMSRYKTSRFQGNEQQGSYGWRNSNFRNRRTFVSESSTTESWNLMNSCGPVSYHGSGEAAQTWNLEKPVS